MIRNSKLPIRLESQLIFKDFPIDIGISILTSHLYPFLIALKLRSCSKTCNINCIVLEVPRSSLIIVLLLKLSAIAVLLPITLTIVTGLNSGR